MIDSSIPACMVKKLFKNSILLLWSMVLSNVQMLVLLLFQCKSQHGRPTEENDAKKQGF